jgi:hypothetical protein
VPAATEHPLLRHPASCCAAVRTIAASACLTKDGSLLLSYDVRGEPGSIRIPETQPSGAADGLWQRTCCEAFVAAVDAPEYREFNFSPSGQWAAYRFSAYRNRDSGFVPPAAPQLDCRSDAAGFRLTARIAPELLPAATAFNIGLSVVIEAADGARSYWALAHAGAQPDFHHRQSFTLTLIRP